MRSPTPLRKEISNDWTRLSSLSPSKNIFHLDVDFERKAKRKEEETFNSNRRLFEASRKKRKYRAKEGNK